MQKNTQLELQSKTFDLVYLSYFIDYDTDQAATFDTVVDLVKSGGRIVLEGWFPVRPFALLESDADAHSFVTRGVTAEEDVLLIINFLNCLATSKGRMVVLERVIKTHRYVQSHYGFCRLPSYFLTFVVSNT